MSGIVVIGSSSMDLVVTSSVRPGAGETVLGESFKTVPGGKGANQAVAAARLGAEVTIIGCVGKDSYGESISKNFELNGVNTAYLKQIPDCATGTAHIILADGDNSIVVVKGANDFVTKEYIKEMTDVIKKADIVMIQQEIPVETVEYVSELCEEFSVPLLLNPAPARLISKEVIERATYITPNEHEASLLATSLNETDLVRKYPNKIVVTEGKQGVRFYNGNEEMVVPTYSVDVVDTTGAGDTFNAAFAVALVEGQEIVQALRFANRAASLSVMKFGAQGGMPTRKEVEAQL